jgi:hypothetical protein
MRAPELKLIATNKHRKLGVVMKAATRSGEAVDVELAKAEIQAQRALWASMNAHSQLAQTNFIAARFNLETGIFTEEDYINRLLWLSSSTRTKIESMKKQSPADILSGVLCEIDASLIFMCDPSCFCRPVWPDEDMDMGAKAVDLEVSGGELDSMKIQVKAGRRNFDRYDVPTLKNSARAVKQIATGENSDRKQPISEVVTSYDLEGAIRPIFDAQKRARISISLPPEDQSLLAVGGMMSSTLIGKIKSPFIEGEILEQTPTQARSVECCPLNHTPHTHPYKVCLQLL